MSELWKTPQIKEIVLERINLTASLRFPKQDLKYLQTYMREQLDEFIITFLYTIGSKIQSKEIHFSTFKRWQDHFKFINRKKWWMRLWIKKHPIEFGQHKYKIQQCTVFPEFDIPLFLKNEIQYVYYNYFEGSDNKI